MTYFRFDRDVRYLIALGFAAVGTFVVQHYFDPPMTSIAELVANR
jgi:hypothetical protein